MNTRHFLALGLLWGSGLPWVFASSPSSLLNTSQVPSSGPRWVVNGSSEISSADNSSSGATPSLLTTPTASSSVVTSVPSTGGSISSASTPSTRESISSARSIPASVPWESPARMSSTPASSTSVHVSTKTSARLESTAMITKPLNSSATSLTTAPQKSSEPVTSGSVAYSSAPLKTNVPAFSRTSTTASAHSKSSAPNITASATPESTVSESSDTTHSATATVSLSPWTTYSTAPGQPYTLGTTLAVILVVAILIMVAIVALACICRFRRRGDYAARHPAKAGAPWAGPVALGPEEGGGGGAEEDPNGPPGEEPPPGASHRLSLGTFFHKRKSRAPSLVLEAFSPLPEGEGTEGGEAQRLLGAVPSPTTSPDPPPPPPPEANGDHPATIPEDTNALLPPPLPSQEGDGGPELV
ncbi:mucin-17-like [Mobula hypostoma]|uniref:mucin-17-like n=1 Tax=Mobula hypostoma TaxID=723540 RepID=UPI002FC2E020